MYHIIREFTRLCEDLIERFNSDLKREHLPTFPSVRDVRLRAITRFSKPIRDFREKFGEPQRTRTSATSLIQFRETAREMLIEMFINSLSNGNSATESEFYFLTNEDGEFILDEARGNVQVSVPYKWLLPSIAGDDYEVLHTAMPVGYCTYAPPSPDLACDFCLKPIGSAGEFEVKHCGHSLCLSNIAFHRPDGDCDEERNHCDICYKFLNDKQCKLCSVATKNMNSTADISEIWEKELELGENDNNSDDDGDDDENSSRNDYNRYNLREQNEAERMEWNRQHERSINRLQSISRTLNNL